MKDLYKRLGIDPKTPEASIREVVSSPAAMLDAGALEAAEFVLLDKKRRVVYDRTHRTLLAIGELRSHLGLNYKTFWVRGRLRDFTYELAAPVARGQRRTIRPADIRRAFGLGLAEPADDGLEGRSRRLAAAVVLFAITLAAAVILVYVAMSR